MNRIFFLILFLSLQNVPYAKIVSPSLNQLVQKADWIGEIKIFELDTLHGKKIKATAKVNKVLKGDPSDSIHFFVYKIWTCDVSTAKAGENCLLFLSGNYKERSILWSGRGKFNIVERDAEKLFEMHNGCL
jgi:hypothetical protein